MSRRLLSGMVAACVLFGVPATTTAEEPVPPPNIVVFYLDDAAAHDGRLWENAALTPAIHENFVAKGLEFTNAIVENPMCCPARGNLLTGLHTHNNGLLQNDARLFDPTMHVGQALKNVGYSTMWIGKYLNRNDMLSAEQWQAHQAGWTHMDSIYGVNGAFWGYTLRTKTGDIDTKGYHSTQMIGDRMVQHLRATPSDTPVFSILSFYNLHAPNSPLPEFKDSTKCDGMPPWNPPNYNEADVSDKPAEVQALALQPYADGWPMAGYCREMLGIDKIVGQVTDELEAQGRLDNTLLVFTADNGMAWGAHRFGQQKRTPYTTPVPLYMSWSARWAGLASVAEHTTNIDLAPTFCDLGGCTLTGYPGGQSSPDGVSLVPLLDGEVATLGRDALLEVSYLSGQIPWQAVRTTAEHPRGLWHYVEHANGERELYDLSADEWELENLAGVPASDDLMSELHQRLNELRNEGVTAETGSIRISQRTLGENGVDFSFSGDLGPFTLDGDEDPAVPGEVVFAGLPTGTYSITQGQVAGWELSGIACNLPFGEANLATRTLTIDLQPNRFIWCTFTNGGIQPDAAVSLTSAGPFKGDGLYSPVAIKGQTVKRLNVKRGVTYSYWVSIQNDGSQSESLNVRATVQGSTRMKASYFAPHDVTTQVSNGTYKTVVLAPGESTSLRVDVKVGRRAGASAKLKVDVAASSSNDTSRVDVVRAVTAR